MFYWQLCLQIVVLFIASRNIYSVGICLFILDNAKGRLVAERCVSYLASDDVLGHVPEVRCHNRRHLLRHRMIQRKSKQKRTYFPWFIITSVELRCCLTSMAAFCKFDWEKLNVKTSFQTGFRGSPDFPVLLFFFLTRLPFIIRYNWNGWKNMFSLGCEFEQWTKTITAYFHVWLLSGV